MSGRKTEVDLYQLKKSDDWGRLIVKWKEEVGEHLCSVFLFQ